MCERSQVMHNLGTTGAEKPQHNSVAYFLHKRGIWGTAQTLTAVGLVKTSATHKDDYVN